MPVVASALALTLLPIAYISFFILNNKRRFLGPAVGVGWTRVAFNVAMVIAILFACVGSLIGIKTRVIDKVFPTPPPVAARTGDGTRD
jgi:hypothetical protein